MTKHKSQPETIERLDVSQLNQTLVDIKRMLFIRSGPITEVDIDLAYFTAASLSFRFLIGEIGQLQVTDPGTKERLEVANNIDTFKQLCEDRINELLAEAKAIMEQENES